MRVCSIAEPLLGTVKHLKFKKMFHIHTHKIHHTFRVKFLTKWLLEKYTFFHVFVHCTLVIPSVCMAGLQMSDPGWYQKLTGHLTDPQKKEIQQIFVLADQRLAARGTLICSVDRNYKRTIDVIHVVKRE